MQVPSTRKIVIISSFAGKGGIQTHLRGLIKALQEENIKVLGISLNQSAQDTSLDSPTVKYLSASVLQNNHLKSIHLKFHKLVEIKKLIDDFAPNIYLCVGTGWSTVIPLLFTKTKFCKIFYEVMPSCRNWNDPRWLIKFVFDLIAAQSPSTAANFADSFAWNKPIHILPAFPEPLEVTTDLPQATYKRVAIGKAKAALFSRLVPHKQAFWLLQQWHDLQDVLAELHIYGSGPEQSLIQTYINTNALEERVKCFGKYPSNQAYADLLSKYDLTLLPTRGPEGIPLVLVETIACGVPFVAYAVGGIPDYAKGNSNVLVVPLETESTTNNFVEGVRQMAHKLAFGEINQVQLQKFYLDHYGYEVVKKAWLSYLYG